MARGLDHIVHAVHDLAAAAALYRGLGFTVGSRNRHPWGTHNHIVQFPDCFVELLTLAEPDKLGSDGFSTLFGVYNDDFLKRHEGLSLLILQSHDAAADEAAGSSARASGRTAQLSSSASRSSSPRILQRPTFTSPSVSSTIRKISGVRPFRNIPIASPVLPA
jgi:hypothetical protein